MKGEEEETEEKGAGGGNGKSGRGREGDIVRCTNLQSITETEGKDEDEAAWEVRAESEKGGTNSLREMISAKRKRLGRRRKRLKSEIKRDDDVEEENEAPAE